MLARCARLVPDPRTAAPQDVTDTVGLSDSDVRDGDAAFFTNDAGDEGNAFCF